MIVIYKIEKKKKLFIKIIVKVDHDLFIMCTSICNAIGYHCQNIVASNHEIICFFDVSYMQITFAELVLKKDIYLH